MLKEPVSWDDATTSRVLKLVKSARGDDVRIELHDVTEDVERFYTQADILLFASLNDIELSQHITLKLFDYRLRPKLLRLLWKKVLMIINTQKRKQ